MTNIDEIQSALNAIKPSALTYEEWVEVGMALKDAGYSSDIWDTWSQNDERYKSGECARKWKTFHGLGEKVTILSIFKKARELGWKSDKELKVLTWDSVIDTDGDETQEESTPKKESVTNITSDYLDMPPTAQLKKYLSVLFKEDDYVSIVTSAYQRDDGKWTPANSGINFKVSDLIKSIDRHPDDLGACIGDWNTEAGAWIRFNPSDGKGAKDENAKAYRYTLVESDELDIEEQYKAYKDLNLPIAALVKSGGKSLHAIVRIDAENEKEYRQRVQFLYNFLDNHHFKVDEANRNVMRLSRLPGVTRGTQVQQLITTNMGALNWSEWRNEIDFVNNPLPDIKTLSELVSNPPKMPEELIKGVLRESHKMIVGAPSKAGKTFLMIELATAIAEGSTWLKWECNKGKILYINFEVEEASFLERIKAVYKTKQLVFGDSNPNFKNFCLWTLRGYTEPLDKLAPMITRYVNLLGGVKGIIFDPLYKILIGDENTAGDMSKLCNLFDKISHETGASVIYTHHHSKGIQGSKHSIDRMSGSGVLARDPDVILDVIQVFPNPQRVMSFEDEIDDDATYWQVSGSLREFKSFQPFNVKFSYPCHYVDTSHNKDDFLVDGDPHLNLKGKNDNNEQREKLLQAYEKLRKKPTDGVTIQDLAKYFDKTERTVRSWLGSQADLFKFLGGLIYTKEDLKEALKDPKSDSLD